MKNLEFIRNYFPKKNCRLNRKKIRNIFFIGRLVQSKDPYFFLRGCNLAHKLNKFHINIVGKGPEKEKLVKFSKRNKLNIKFHGFIKNPFKFFKTELTFCLTLSMMEHQTY